MREIRAEFKIIKEGGRYSLIITHRLIKPDPIRKKLQKTFNQALENFRLAADDLGKEFVNLVFRIFRRFGK